MSQGVPASIQVNVCKYDGWKVCFIIPVYRLPTESIGRRLQDIILTAYSIKEALSPSAMPSIYLYFQ